MSQLIRYAGADPRTGAPYAPPLNKIGNKKISPPVSPHNIFALHWMALNSINAPSPKLKPWIRPCYAIAFVTLYVLF